MITGYNTDVRHQDVVFHVQTEDKGAANPFIESLVYVGGQVLATKRASYANLLSEGKDEKAIVALMDHQHRTMIAAIKHGKFDEKLTALTASRQTGRHAVVLPPPDGRPPGAVPLVAPPVPPDLERTVVPLPPPPPPRTPERTLDQVILEYLTNEADQEQLLLVVEGDQQLALGRNAFLTLRTSSSKSGMPIAGAQVTVKMISTVSEPRALGAGRTDEAGTLELSLAIPPLHRGTAALIITAVSDIGRAELKHLL
jgi:hypothetical protein